MAKAVSTVATSPEEKRWSTNESNESWKWEKVSKTHEKKFEKLIKHGQEHPGEIMEINGVRVCLDEKFLISTGGQSNGVYVGLGKDGSEKAVKLFLKATHGHLAQKEKELLIKCETKELAHVVRYWYLDNTSHNTFAFLIMELCEETLETFVTRNGQDGLIKAAPGILKQILKGLADLHREPCCILHRDVKPLNILRNANGKWLLADFGIGRILSDDETTFMSMERGTKKWRAVESCSESSTSGDGRVRYKTKSDIQVTGMVAFYILTKRKHPFGENEQRIHDNLLAGNPVNLNMLDSHPLAKDLISWMLSHDPNDRPSAEEALQHPYLKSNEQQFNLLCGIGNESHVKKKDVNSDVVKELNKDTTDWRTRMDSDVLNYLSYDQLKKISFKYTSSWTDCLRLIRNIKEHWKDCPRTEPEAMKVGDPQEYFLHFFPDLVLRVYKIIRSCDDLKELPGLKEYFRGVPLESQERAPANDNKTDPIGNEDSISDVPESSFRVTKVTGETADVRSLDNKDLSAGVEHIVITAEKSDLNKYTQRKRIEEMKTTNSVSKKKALETAINKYGENHADTARKYNEMGVAQFNMKDYKSALQLFQHALEIRLKLFGENHADTARSYHNIGASQHEMKDYESALQSHQHALEIRLKLFGENRADTARSYHEIGAAQHKMKDYKSALQSLQHALEIRLKLFGENHAATTRSYYSIGVTQHKMKDYKSALLSFQHGLEIKLKLFGENHADTAQSYYSIGRTQREMKDYKFALQSHQHALEIRLNLFQENHADTAESYHEIGVTQHEMKDYKSALQSHQHALEIRLKLFGENHADTVSTYKLIERLRGDMKDGFIIQYSF